MSVDAAIERYGLLVERVFSQAKPFGGDGKFSASKLEDVIKRIIEEHTGEADERMMDPQSEGTGCKTYVIYRSPKNVLTLLFLASCARCRH